MTRGRTILFWLQCLTLAGFFLPDWPLLSDLWPYLTSLWLITNWRSYRPKLLALLQTRIGQSLASLFGFSVLSILWSDATPTIMAKSLGYCLWSLGFVLAIVFTLEEKPRRLYILSTILLTGSLISAIYGLGAYLQDRHTTENPRLHESFIPLARCQVPLDKPHTEIDVTRLSNTACIDLAQRNGESMQYPYWRLQSYGKLNHSVLAALVYGLCLSLCVALQQGTPRRYRIPLTMAALVFVITLYLCGSLGILVGFAVALVFVITHQLVSDRHWRQRYWLALIGVAIGGLLLSNEYISVLITYLPRGLSFRDVIWSEMVAQMSLSTWLWGHGLGHSL